MDIPVAAFARLRYQRDRHRPGKPDRACAPVALLGVRALRMASDSAQPALSAVRLGGLECGAPRRDPRVWQAHPRMISPSPLFRGGSLTPVLRVFTKTAKVYKRRPPTIPGTMRNYLCRKCNQV